MHEVTERVKKLADYFEEHAAESDELGRISDGEADVLRTSGVVRLLQPKEYSGYEAHPAEFFETVLEVGAHSPAAGWVSGVVGVHPFEIAMMDPRVQEEIWGEDPDTWAASPYAPLGRATKVDGGYVLNGRWPFSSGTDHCRWIILGGIVTDDDGQVGMPPDVRHFVLPRSDYEILHDTWNVVGLQGSGSKDVVVRDAFLPEYRVVGHQKMNDGWYAEQNRPGHPLYAIPFGVMFPGAIVTSTLAMCEGALGAFVAYTRQRITVGGSKTSQDPFHLATLGEASADIAAGRRQLLGDITDMYEYAKAGGEITLSMKLENRRNQVRLSRRAVDAVDRIFAHAGGGSLHLNQPMQRFWRDVHAGMVHVCNVAEPMYVAYGLDLFGNPIPPGTMI
jgi:3-hydroxy-9,10-secoandrosta-1,3,5(10)-triene-9,17-dione monooxygenase